jgi:F0F1-type ATP synthase assembly protein I
MGAWPLFFISIIALSFLLGVLAVCRSAAPTCRS